MKRVVHSSYIRKFPVGVFLMLSIVAGFSTMSLSAAAQPSTENISEDICVCGAPCDLIVAGQTVTTTALFEACNTLQIGPDFILSGAAAEVTVHAGNTIGFLNGFTVGAGSRFSANIQSSLACDPSANIDGDSSDACHDCNDTNSNIYPGAVELCDGEDNDCNSLVDDEICLIGTVCYQATEDNPANECQECNPASSFDQWSDKANETVCSDDGRSCTLDQCSAGQCTHPYDSFSGECLINGTCYSDGDSNPTNSCLYCNASDAGWLPYDTGTVCEGEGNSCILDLCDGSGSCLHYNEPDLASCDDGNVTTVGDVCFSQECNGFEHAIHDVVSGATEKDAYTAASFASDTSVHAVGPSTSDGTSLQASLFESSIMPTNIVDLSTPIAPAGVIPRFLTTNDQLFEFVDGAWTNSADANTFREAWQDVTTNLNTAFVGLDYTFVPGESILHGIGRNADDTALAVRKCTQIFIPTFITNCIDQQVSDVFTSSVYPVDVTHILDTPYIGVNYLNPDTPSYWRVLYFDSNVPQWESAAVYYLGINSGPAMRAFTAAGNNYLVSAGGDGKLVVWEASAGAITRISEILIPGLINQSDIDFIDITEFGDMVLVLGSYKEDFGNFQTRTFLLAGAKTNTNLRVSANWSVHIIDTVSNDCPVDTSCPDIDIDTVMNALAADANSLYIFGGWFNDVNEEQDSAVWRMNVP